jgi:hypothetical protein
LSGYRLDAEERLKNAVDDCSIPALTVDTLTVTGDFV